MPLARLASEDPRNTFPQVGILCLFCATQTDRDRQQQQPVSEHNSTTAVTTADSSHGNSGACALPFGELHKQIQMFIYVISWKIIYLGSSVKY